jgi:hypothetical protein
LEYPRDFKEARNLIVDTPSSSILVAHEPKSIVVIPAGMRPVADNMKPIELQTSAKSQAFTFVTNTQIRRFPYTEGKG